MINFKTDDNGELLIENDNFVDCTELESIAQNVKSRVKTKKEEWFLNKEIGVDYKRGREKGNEELLIYTIKSEILKVIGVVSISKFTTEYIKNLRQIKISATIQTRSGLIYVNEVF